ncbi:hypothetical protein, partial [Corallococcus sp. CA041A]
AGGGTSVIPGGGGGGSGGSGGNAGGTAFVGSPTIDIPSAGTGGYFLQTVAPEPETLLGL